MNREAISYQEKKPVDTGGFTAVLPIARPLAADRVARGDQRRTSSGVGFRNIEKIDRSSRSPGFPTIAGSSSSWPRRRSSITRPSPAGRTRSCRRRGPGSTSEDKLAEQWLYTVIYFQGATALRQGENDNCIMCRGESSCILPISKAAVHTKPARLAAGDQAFHRVPRRGFPTTSKRSGS